MTELTQRGRFTGKVEGVEKYAKLTGKQFTSLVLDSTAQDLVDELIITKGQVRGLKRNFSHQGKVKAEEWENTFSAFNERVNQYGIQVSDELHEAGAAFFRVAYSGIVKHALEIWNLEGKELVTRAGTEEIRRFRFKGFADVTANFARCHFPGLKTLVPVYEVELMDNVKFRYAYASWQSGFRFSYNPEYYIA